MDKTPSQNLLIQIKLLTLLIGQCSEFSEPVNVFDIDPIVTLKT